MDKFLDVKNKVMQMGYHTYHIEDIIKENIGHANLNDIGISGRQRLITVFEEYIEFANKCKKVK